MGAASRERPDATSPRTAMTSSREISLETTVEDSPSLDCVSSVMSLSCLPRMPPALLSSSTASSVPRWEERPKAASLPVREAYSPMLMNSEFAAEPPCFLHPVHAARAKTRLKAASQFLGIDLMEQIIATELAGRQL